MSRRQIHAHTHRWCWHFPFETDILHCWSFVNFPVQVCMPRRDNTPGRNLHSILHSIPTFTHDIKQISMHIMVPTKAPFSFTPLYRGADLLLHLPHTRCTYTHKHILPALKFGPARGAWAIWRHKSVGNMYSMYRIQPSPMLAGWHDGKSRMEARCTECLYIGPDKGSGQDTRQRHCVTHAPYHVHCIPL